MFVSSKTHMEKALLKRQKRTRQTWVQSLRALFPHACAGVFLKWHLIWRDTYLRGVGSVKERWGGVFYEL